MTPDEHAAEAERILAIPATVAELNGRALVHALLATRPTPPAGLTDGPTPRLTIADYDAAMMRALAALYEAMPPTLRTRYTLRDALPWVKAAVDAFSDPNPTEPS